jgi:hypothetical protein
MGARKMHPLPISCCAATHVTDILLSNRRPRLPHKCLTMSLHPGLRRAPFCLDWPLSSCSTGSLTQAREALGS